MAINPIAYTEKVTKSFLRYQLTSYPFTDSRLNNQMRSLLSLDETRNSPLIKGPFISLSRSFRQGSSIDKLVGDGVFHPHMRQRIPANISHLYGHQDKAVRAIHSGRTTLVSTGTGSGKTECFLYPVISRCLRLRDEGAGPGICAVIVYPMNALAEDQLGRLRGLLAGTGITFGMYVGKTPETEGEVAGLRMPAGASRAEYEASLEKVRAEKRSETVHPAEEVCSREAMRTAGGQPRILLTNEKQLELLLTRQRDVELFNNARLDYLIFDEAHTYTGAKGAETACLIRRLRNFCGRSEQDTVCIATSATIVDVANPLAAQQFASRFFGVPADSIITVNEDYENDIWSTPRILPQAPKDPSAALQACVAAVDDALPENATRNAYKNLCGGSLPEGEWQEALYRALSQNELLYQISSLLHKPQQLGELPKILEEAAKRPVTEEEILAWLTLGAAARNEQRPLIRPVVHIFARGISGAVVCFPEGSNEPRLYLAAEDEAPSGTDEELAHFPISTCTTCGQHYYESSLVDFEYTGKVPTGGHAIGTGSCWEPLSQNLGGRRVLLVDKLIGDDEDDTLDEKERLSELYFCRHCGAAHPKNLTDCLHCGKQGTLVSLFAVQQNEDNPGKLSSCISCKATGRKMGATYREPARPVRATQVADVHVLAQDMVQQAERKRLLIFSDNRQDAAFQAGWMRDHARRFRLRSLMADALREGGASIGDITNHVNDVLERDESLSRRLIPEVWRVQRKEGAGGRHEQERRKYLRIQVLREVAMSSRQALGLEPWGRMKVEYQGLDSSLPWIQDNANKLGIPPDEMRNGVAVVLDYFRRKRIIWDAEYQLFSKIWGEGDVEILQGYVPDFGRPEGTKFSKTEQDKTGYVSQWFSIRGDTTLKQLARKWGVEQDQIQEFLESLFHFLTSPDRKLLVPVTLRGSKGKQLPFVSGVFQVNGDLLRMHANHGFYQCATCRRRTPRNAPLNKCPAWRCEGELGFVREERDNYNLQLLDQRYDMIRPEEHTAMVPHDERERLENLFRGDSEALNTLVCTPTLELGVDIGQLDMVLMRNVPPLPANYWQRAGRAGRRHRMAVDVTYCRNTSHDRSYFRDPLKLLTGRVDPPAFNLRNEVMVSKHVHATVLTRLQQYTRDNAMPDAERSRVESIMGNCFPQQVKHYLFDAQGALRNKPFDLADFEDLVERNIEDLLAYVEGAFRQGWPQEEQQVVTQDALREHIRSSVSGLNEVIQRLRKRLQWAISQINRLNSVRVQQGTLDPEDDALFKRCDNLVKKLKGIRLRGRADAEGYDDVNTLGVLAAEGFLPGYGLESGSILGTAQIPFWMGSGSSLSLPRPPSVALREFVPGNAIYTNNNRFVARRFHRDIDEERADIPLFEFSTDRNAVKQIVASGQTAQLDSNVISAIAVCDVELVHQSHISDEEEFRFQLGVSVYGMERGQHNGGVAYAWGNQPVHHRRGVRFRMVNIGANLAMQKKEPVYGYPVCTVCGQSVSPLSSDKQLSLFRENHFERCGKKVQNIGFYADITADAVILPDVTDKSIAYSVLETLRMACTQVLDMHLEDLQILMVGNIERDEVSAVLWDPMPGGSGLLDLFCERFSEIQAVAIEIVSNCPSECKTSCIDCLQTFRNSFYHPFLDRHLAKEQLELWGNRIVRSHEIPALHSTINALQTSQVPVNNAENTLREMLQRAGFNDGIRGEQIRLSSSLGTTTPDIIYRSESDGQDEGMAVYLDGMSRTLHGNPERIPFDRQIREWLENNGFEVVTIPANELSDPEAMARHFRRIAKYLNDDNVRTRIQNSRSWFKAPEDQEEGDSNRFVIPGENERFVKALPFIPLKIAAGSFGNPNFIHQDEYRWVRYDGSKKLTRDMFVAQVEGKSMEPEIPDGSFCLFRHGVEGSRQGKVVLVQLLGHNDPETGFRFTIKRYESSKVHDDDGTWKHVKIILKPVNPDFQNIELTGADENEVSVVAELIEVL